MGLTKRSSIIPKNFVSWVCSSSLVSCLWTQCFFVSFQRGNRLHGCCGVLCCDALVHNSQESHTKLTTRRSIRVVKDRRQRRRRQEPMHTTHKSAARHTNKANILDHVPRLQDSRQTPKAQTNTHLTPIRTLTHQHKASNHALNKLTWTRLRVALSLRLLLVLFGCETPLLPYVKHNRVSCPL